MAKFTDSFRMERVYFEKLRSDISICRSYIEAGATDEAKALLENAVDVDGAVLLLYRNLGECWAELADLIEKTRKDLADLAEKTEKYHDELNEKIDEVNNYLIRLINALDERVTALENESKVKFAYLYYDETEDAYFIQMDGETVTYNDLYDACTYPHYVVIIGEDGNEYDLRYVSESGINWYADGIIDGKYTEYSVFINTSDVVTVTDTVLSSKEPYRVDIVYDGSTPYAYHDGVAVTMTEIKGAFDDGKFVYAVQGSQNYHYYLYQITASYCNFIMFEGGTSSSYHGLTRRITNRETWTVAADGVCTYTQTSWEIEASIQVYLNNGNYSKQWAWADFKALLMSASTLEYSVHFPIAFVSVTGESGAWHIYQPYKIITTSGSNGVVYKEDGTTNAFIVNEDNTIAAYTI